MDAVKQVFEIDYTVLIISGCTILLAAKFISQLLEWLIIDKLGIETKWGRKKRQEHDLLINTANKVNKLEEIHMADMIKSDKNDNEIKNILNEFIEQSSARNEKVRSDLEKAVLKIETTVEKINNDNLSHWDASKGIRDKMNDRINKVVDSNVDRDNLIKAIANGNKELLGDKIDQKFDKYVKLRGIPANEVDEFESLCNAYFKLNGNHNRKKKYEYVKMNMDVIPVKTELISNA